MSQPPNEVHPSQLADDDLPENVRGALAALRRAALRARLVAEQTGTDLIVVRAGQVVRIPPQSKIPHEPAGS